MLQTPKLIIVFFFSLATTKLEACGIPEWYEHELGEHLVLGDEPSIDNKKNRPTEKQPHLPMPLTPLERKLTQLLYPPNIHPASKPEECMTVDSPMDDGKASNNN